MRWLPQKAKRILFTAIRTRDSNRGFIRLGKIQQNRRALPFSATKSVKSRCAASATRHGLPGTLCLLGMLGSGLQFLGRPAGHLGSGIGGQRKGRIG